jgi:hypothetical protein
MCMYPLSPVLEIYAALRVGLLHLNAGARCTGFTLKTIVRDQATLCPKSLFSHNLVSY